MQDMRQVYLANDTWVIPKDDIRLIKASMSGMEYPVLQTGHSGLTATAFGKTHILTQFLLV